MKISSRWGWIAVTAVVASSLIITGAYGADEEEPVKQEQEKVILAIHGGTHGNTSAPENADEYRKTMEKALQSGKKELDSGGSSLNAVESAIKVLEDSPLFNAGKGAVFNTDAGHELDASIMNGKDLSAGSVAGVKNTKNPITLARLVMEKSPHVMLAGEAADRFGMEHGLKPVTQDYFYTERRWNELMEAKKKQQVQTDQHGTVGAIALDSDGNLAAGTSTGGLTNKAVGRVGDSPIIGAGTYADNESVAVSATGKGEVFIRGTAAHDIAALVKYQKTSVKEAADEVVKKKLMRLGGTGGVIAIDHQGNFASPHTSPGMFYGYMTNKGNMVIVLSAEDEK
ncbi:isoaspartyl peptidase/L-asparaginase [Marinithermofilum abyssi]|uniref:Isoaspartyl peptidase/L-asparaginase n=1 Tax=Marinithermofilum abyssi TaxID=1571185 RepID=A0A8J2VHI2_9BACL|nr:isoaspartyl peptidase/L-asparaginase [Marinithermofilum abyssi]GGE16084.1 isoaspartyl peptidase/L-asparaginase [Marinithermofilum abyssi]